MGNGCGWRCWRKICFIGCSWHQRWAIDETWRHSYIYKFCLFFSFLHTHQSCRGLKSGDGKFLPELSLLRIYVPFHFLQSPITQLTALIDICCPSLGSVGVSSSRPAPKMRYKEKAEDVTSCALLCTTVIRLLLIAVALNLHKHLLLL